MSNRSLAPDIAISTTLGIINLLCFIAGRRWYNGVTAVLLIIYGIMLDGLNTRRYDDDL